MFSGISAQVTQIALGIIGVAMAFTLVTSNNTASIISAIGSTFSGSLSAAMGRAGTTTRTL
jgi:hypothetical protein